MLHALPQQRQDSVDPLELDQRSSFDSGRGGPDPFSADEALWSKCSAKGLSFHHAFGDTDVEQENSKLSNSSPASANGGWSCTIEHLAALGFTMYALTPENRDFDFYRRWGVGRALRDLGLSDKVIEDGGNIWGIRVVHGNIWSPTNIDQQTYQIPWDSRTWRCTGASYMIGVNTIEGALFFMNRQSPKLAALDRQPQIPDDELPTIGASSDVAWSLWQRAAGEANLKNLKWCFMLSIANDETKRIIKRALDQKQAKLGPYPGVWLTMGDEEGRAILGSPNGVGLGYFLAQHKAELGNFYVAGVVVFHGDTSHKMPCLAFAIRGPPAQAQTPTVDIKNTDSFPMPFPPV